MIKANTFKQCKYTLQGHGSGLRWKTLEKAFEMFFADTVAKVIACRDFRLIQFCDRKTLKQF